MGEIIKIEIFCDSETEEYTVYVDDNVLFDDECFIANDRDHAIEIADDLRSQFDDNDITSFIEE